MTYSKEQYTEKKSNHSQFYFNLVNNLNLFVVRLTFGLWNININVKRERKKVDFLFDYRAGSVWSITWYLCVCLHWSVAIK